jgi:hypothetical protein
MAITQSFKYLFFKNVKILKPDEVKHQSRWVSIGHPGKKTTLIEPS